MQPCKTPRETWRLLVLLSVKDASLCNCKTLQCYRSVGRRVKILGAETREVTRRPQWGFPKGPLFGMEILSATLEEESAPPCSQAPSHELKAPASNTVWLWKAAQEPRLQGRWLHLFWRQLQVPKTKAGGAAAPKIS